MVIGREKIGTCENDNRRADEKADAAEVRAGGYGTTRFHRATGHRSGDCPGRSAAGEKSWRFEKEGRRSHLKGSKGRLNARPRYWRLADDTRCGRSRCRRAGTKQ